MAEGLNAPDSWLHTIATYRKLLAPIWRGPDRIYIEVFSKRPVTPYFGLGRACW